MLIFWQIEHLYVSVVCPCKYKCFIKYRLSIIFLRTCKSSNFICKTYPLWENHELLQESKLTHNYEECFLGAGKILRCSKCLWCCDIHCINIPEFKTIPFMLKVQAKMYIHVPVYTWCICTHTVCLFMLYLHMLLNNSKLHQKFCEINDKVWQMENRGLEQGILSIYKVWVIHLHYHHN